MQYLCRTDEQLLRGYTGRLFLIVTGAFLFLKLGQRLLAPLLPVIINDLGITPFAAGIALSLLSIVRALLQYPSGRASDQLSRKTVLLLAIGCGLLGLIVILTSTTYALLLLGIAIFGIGLGMFDPAARGLISDIFVKKRGRAFGFHIVAGDIAGTIAGGLAIVVVAFTWQTAFLPSVLLLLPIFLLFLRWNTHESVVIQWLESDILSTALRLLRRPQLRWALLAYSLIVFASAGIIGFLAEFLVAVHGFSIEFSGMMFILLYSIGIFVKPLAGWLSDHVSRMIVVSGGILLGSASLLLLIVAPTRPVVIAAIVGYALGQRAFPPPFQAFLMDQFPDDSMGGDLGALRTIYMTVGSLGPAYIGFTATHANYPVAYATMVLCFASAGVIAFRLTA